MFPMTLMATISWQPLCWIMKFHKISTSLWLHLPCPTAANKKASTAVPGDTSVTSLYNKQRKSPPAPTLNPPRRAIYRGFKISLEEVTAAACRDIQSLSSQRHYFSIFRQTFNIGYVGVCFGFFVYLIFWGFVCFFLHVAISLMILAEIGKEKHSSTMQNKVRQFGFTLSFCWGSLGLTRLSSKTSCFSERNHLELQEYSSYGNFSKWCYVESF